MTCLGAISRYPLLLLGHSYLVSCGVSATIGDAHCPFLSDLLKSDADMHNVYADAVLLGRNRYARSTPALAMALSTRRL